jgi:hypothetical protein
VSGGRQWARQEDSDYEGPGRERAGGTTTFDWERGRMGGQGMIGDEEEKQSQMSVTCHFLICTEDLCKPHAQLFLKESNKLSFFMIEKSMNQLDRFSRIQRRDVGSSQNTWWAGCICFIIHGP